MLHFLRHIRQKLIIQENVRKYLLYALGEITLVMIGILLALQVNNWNQQRLENEFQDKMVDRLVEEFKSNRKELDIDIGRLQKTLDSVEQTISFIDGTLGKDLSEEEILEMFTTTLTDPTWNPSSFVLADLKSNGQISFLKNNVLIDLLFAWERFYANLLEYQIYFVEVNKQYVNHTNELGVMVNIVKQRGLTDSQTTVDTEAVITRDELIYYHLHRKLIQGLILMQEYELTKERLDEIIKVAE